MLVQLVEFPRRLEMDHFRQVFVGHGWELELPQFDAGTSDRHQRLGTSDAPGVEFLRDQFAKRLLA